MSLLSVFEEAYRVRVASSGKPTGAIVSPDLWKALNVGGEITMMPAQIRLTGTPTLDGLPPQPIEEKLPTYQGTVVQVDPALGDDGEFRFSPRSIGA